MSDAQEAKRFQISRRIDQIEDGQPLLISDLDAMDLFGFTLSEYLTALKARLDVLGGRP